MTNNILNILKKKSYKQVTNNFFFINGQSDLNQIKTNTAFSKKWKNLFYESETKSFQKTLVFQKKWFLKLYGFNSNSKLKSFLEKKKIIIDAGCGLGDKTAWFANLAKNSLVIGIDNSESIHIAAKRFKNISNLFFVKGDISKLKFIENSIDLIICDQVIMHTSNPNKTLKNFCSVLKKNSYLFCYWYSKKALPRELVDQYFRTKSKYLNEKKLWQLSEQLTVLGKELSKFKKEINIPNIPLLEIKGGKYNIQRFIYWNFLKCFWNQDLGKKVSTVTNFDWYSPINAYRYDKEELLKILNFLTFKIEYFNIEPNCYSGRFKLLS